MTDGKFSPTNGSLFARYPSASNLQYVSGHCLSAYLSSYIAEVDKVAIVHLKPPTSIEPEKIRGEYESLNNTKIKSVKRHHDQRLASRRTKVPIGRPVTQMEALTVINGEPLVRSTRIFIHLPTCPREFTPSTGPPGSFGCNRSNRPPAKDISGITTFYFSPDASNQRRAQGTIENRPYHTFLHASA
jgi:hypothetical protein